MHETQETHQNLGYNANMKKIQAYIKSCALPIFIALQLSVLATSPITTHGQIKPLKVEGRFGINISSPLMELRVNGKSLKAVQVYPAPGSLKPSAWKLFRRYPSGKLILYYKNGKTNQYHPIAMNNELALHSYPLLILNNDQKLYIIVYNVLKSNDEIYEASAEKKPIVRLLSQNINIGNIDSLVYGNVLNNNIHLCANHHCLTINKKGTQYPWALPRLNKFDIVELIFQNNYAYAILRPKHDDRFNGPPSIAYSQYYLAKISSQGISILSEKFSDYIPYHLFLEKGKIHWEKARNKKEYKKLMLFELNRMAHHGWMDFGSNNYEGRIAWQQTYYLNGLIALINKIQGANNLADDDIRQLIAPSLLKELELMAKLETYKDVGFKTKRYSLNREPLTFAVHLGRIVSLLFKAKSQHLQFPALNTTVSILCEQMQKLANTVEVFSSSKIAANHPELRYKKSVPFWADGVNVPFNYTSAYSEGLLTACTNKKNTLMVSELLQPLITEVTAHQHTWRYWRGLGDNGWETHDNISMNTPKWIGNHHALARITYRSMDAQALLALEQLHSGTLSKTLLNHLRLLVSHGWLQPQVNEALSKLGGPAPLKHYVARRYARSASAIEIESQIWALNDLAGQASS